MTKTKIVALIAAGTILIGATVFITVNIATENQRKVENKELVQACLAVKGFYSGLNTREDLEYLAMGCQLWANNQQQ